MNLKSMSIDRLTTLRDKVDAALRTRVTGERRDLEAQLAKLSRFGGSVGRALDFAKRGGSVPPKYRNPENPSETWAGRGLKPRWLSAALRKGRKIDDFLIDNAKSTKGQRGRKKVARKVSKPRKAKAARRPSVRRKAPAGPSSAQPQASA